MIAAVRPPPDARCQLFPSILSCRLSLLPLSLIGAQREAFHCGRTTVVSRPQPELLDAFISRPNILPHIAHSLSSEAISSSGNVGRCLLVADLSTGRTMDRPLLRESVEGSTYFWCQFLFHRGEQAAALTKAGYFHDVCAMRGNFQKK